VTAPASLFRFCPRCGAPRTGAAGGDPFRCQACGLAYFFNQAAAVAAIVLAAGGRALFIRRARDPARGRLALPGGFVDAGESGEAALRREVREEVGLELGPLTFLSSHPNTYEYGEVTYSTLDLFFVADAVRPDRAQALDAVAGLTWEDPAAVALDEIAFPSMRDALERYRSRPR